MPLAGESARTPAHDAVDSDGDGLNAAHDDCPAVFNADQADGDLDGLGDACDLCADVSDRHYADADGDDYNDVMWLSTDGEQLAWVEGRGRTSSGHWMERTVRGARFARDPAALSPRTLVELGPGYIARAGVGGGWVVVDRPEGELDGALAIELETGAQTAIVAPAGYVFRMEPLYVTSSEVAFAVAARTSLIDRTIWRVALP